MIDPKQLRIGNLTEVKAPEHDFRLATVSTITKRSVHVEFLERSLSMPSWEPGANDIRPIPITKEWLSKCGFKKDGETYYITNAHFYLQWDNVSTIDLVVERKKLFTGCTYIHQLQNLYFSLTEEELEFN